MEAISLILSITASNCLPILTYGLEACSLTKAQMHLLEYAFNTVYCKLFKTFDRAIITQCQYFTASLPAHFAVDLCKMRFLNRVKFTACSPAEFLCRVAGEGECAELERKYNVSLPTYNANLKRAVWQLFEAGLQLDINDD